MPQGPLDALLQMKLELFHAADVAPLHVRNFNLKKPQCQGEVAFALHAQPAWIRIMTPEYFSDKFMRKKLTYVAVSSVQQIREAWKGHLTALIVWNFIVASIEAEKSFIGLGPGFNTNLNLSHGARLDDLEGSFERVARKAPVFGESRADESFQVSSHEAVGGLGHL